ncbi:protease modulator HflC [Oceanispirochaeta crateris]|uniref:Protein HflC n=1 Tax=Oceanispirochaeta crateris TaxID=2518645 RepID=A0A5C1QJ14_9SPIO|nr:protease modulator HflC [Oceanispirochaeta crateris]QEN07040.1 protease modulator HflC [Oceanispirochaeta crateris]
MNNSLKVLFIILVAFVLVAFLGPFYIVTEGEQAIVTRFGKIVKAETDAGLKFRVPFVDNVSRYSKKILIWDGEPQRLPTSENQFIWVDTTARWIISDPAKFYESVSTMNQAYARLDDVIDSAVRTIIAQNPLAESVRSTDKIRTVSEENQEAQKITDDEGNGPSFSFTTGNNFPSIKMGRKMISDQILTRAKILTPQYGIELIDVVIRQIRYSDDLTQSVYARMITERNQIAQAYRSYGEGQKAEWMGKLEREQKSIISGAYAKSEEIKGRADAQSTQIYGDVFGRDPDFYNFWKSMESYKTTLPSLNKTLTTDMDYFRYLYNSEGR